MARSTNDSSEAERSQLVNYFNNICSGGNISEKINELTKLVEKWKDEKLNIAVVGSSGVGKSTFVNTMRGLKRGDPHYARTGVTETTKEIASYPDPKNPNLLYWDLPGCGTPRFPREQYLEKVNFHQYDFFLIITSTRFTEDDLWLSKQIEKDGKSFYFVRNKIGIDLQNEKDEEPETEESAILDKIRRYCLENLRGFDQLVELQKRIFLISAKLENYEKWDFPRLVDSLLRDYPALKREAIISTLRANCKEVIEQKYQMLQKRVWKMSVISAVVAAIPIPGTSIAVDSAFIAKEIQYYKNQFGLDEDSLKKLIESNVVTREQVENLTRSEILNGVFSSNVEAWVGTLLVMFAGDDAFRLLPVVGWFIAARISFSTTAKMLNSILNEMKELSLKLLELRMKKYASTTEN